MTIRRGVDAQSFDARVQLERKTQTQDPTTGSLTDTWVPFGPPLWAKIDRGYRANAISEVAREQEIDGQKKALQVYTVILRWRPGIDAGMRVVWGSRILNIVDPGDNSKRGRILEMFCHEGFSQTGA